MLAIFACAKGTLDDSLRIVQNVSELIEWVPIICSRNFINRQVFSEYLNCLKAVYELYHITDFQYTYVLCYIYCLNQDQRKHIQTRWNGC